MGYTFSCCSVALRCRLRPSAACPRNRCLSAEGDSSATTLNGITSAPPTHLSGAGGICRALARQIDPIHSGAKRPAGQGASGGGVGQVVGWGQICRRSNPARIPGACVDATPRMANARPTPAPALIDCGPPVASRSTVVGVPAETGLLDWRALRCVPRGVRTDSPRPGPW